MKHYLYLSVLFACLLNINISVYAEPDCMNSSHSEEEINVCEAAAAKQLELDILDLEKAIRSRFKSPQVERFDEAQTRWQQMTEKDCEIEANFYEGAAIYVAIQSECLQRHYQERLLTLKKYICPEPRLGNGCEKNDAASTPAEVDLPPAETRVKTVDKPQPIKNTKRFR